MHHGAAVDIVEIVRGLIERFMVVWRAMIVNEETSESLFSELVGQIQVNARSVANTNGIASGKYTLYLQSCWPVIAERNLRNRTTVQPGLATMAFAILCVRIDCIASYRREVGSVFFRIPPGINTTVFWRLRAWIAACSFRDPEDCAQLADAEHRAC